MAELDIKHLITIQQMFFPSSWPDMPLIIGIITYEALLFHLDTT